MTQKSNNDRTKGPSKKQGSSFPFEKVMTTEQVQNSASTTGEKPQQKPQQKPRQKQKSTTTKGRTATAKKSQEPVVQEKRKPTLRKAGTPSPVKVSPTKVIKILPLGGLGEIGKNITLYEYCGEILIVDCGISFPDDDMYGVDLVIPDFTYVLANAAKIRGIIITHGHEDHIGALPFLLSHINVPVFSAKLTIGMIRNKLEERGIAKGAKLHAFEPRDILKIGPFTVQPIAVNHSIPDAVAFAISTPAGVVMHMGDFKVDYSPIFSNPIDLETFASYGKKGVLCMLSDSTNAERAGFTDTEQKVAESFKRLFIQAADRRIFIATFSSNIYRIQQIIELAAQHKRKVVFCGRSMEKNVNIALQLGYIKADKQTIIGLDELRNYSPEKLVVVTTGSQGEPLSALSRMAADSHRNLTVVPGDYVILSATPIPGNEKTVSRVINGLLGLGAEVIYESMYDVHVSGHACAEELKLLLSLVRPQYFLPVHGELRQLIKHARLAQQTGVERENIFIPEVGLTMHVSKKGITKGEVIAVNDIMVDGLGVGDVGSSVLRDRKLLSEEGLIIVSATIDVMTKELLARPTVETKGFVYVKESEGILEDIQSLVETLFDTEQRKKSGKDVLSTKIRDQLQGMLSRRLRRRPIVIPIIHEV